jgi:hypothetical protein
VAVMSQVFRQALDAIVTLVTRGGSPPSRSGCVGRTPPTSEKVTDLHGYVPNCPRIVRQAVPTWIGLSGGSGPTRLHRLPLRFASHLRQLPFQLRGPPLRVRQLPLQLRNASVPFATPRTRRQCSWPPIIHDGRLPTKSPSNRQDHSCGLVNTINHGTSTEASGLHRESRGARQSRHTSECSDTRDQTADHQWTHHSPYPRDTKLAEPGCAAP